MRTFLISLLTVICSLPSFGADVPAKRLLYVAVPGVRNYLEFGGHGVLVFDIDQNHKFVRRIPAQGLTAEGKPINVKGICASAATQRLYVSTIETMQCFDLQSNKLLWEKRYDGGCDRMSITADGKKLFTPSFEKNYWRVLDAANGDEITRIPTPNGAHNTIVSLDGKEAYLADLRSPFLQVVDAASNEVLREVGPFGNFVRPFTVNRSRTRGYMCVNDLLGFEVADLQSGKILHRVEVTGFEKGPVKLHGCPSHGVGLTADESEVWVVDAHNKSLHIFDNTVAPPKQVQSLTVCDEPGWIRFSLDGKLAYPSTGEVIEVATRKTITTLKDETGASVHSEKMVELQLDANGKVIAVGDQFGLGRR